jgi:hypothetical protein
VRLLRAKMSFQVVSVEARMRLTNRPDSSVGAAVLLGGCPGCVCSTRGCWRENWSAMPISIDGSMPVA